MRGFIPVEGRIVARLTGVLIAAAFALGVSLPALFAGAAVSAAQINSASVTMSDSSPSGVSGAPASGPGSGTGVSYQFQFTTSGSAESLVIDFCSNSGIVGDSCTAPAGFSASSATASKPTGATSAIGSWTVTDAASQVKLAGSAVQTAGTQTFDINNLTNPTSTASFYVRVYTYANATFGNVSGSGGYQSATSLGTYVDFGGFALSTSNVISIQARVEPTLQFCVLNVAPTAACANASASNLPNITIGHGTPLALDSTAVDKAQVYSQLSTNAISGATITAHLNDGSSTCYGLVNAADNTICIPAVNSGAGTPSTMTAGTAAFGLNVNNGTALSGGSGSTTANANYSGTGEYGMDTTSSGGQNMIGTFGDVIADASGPTANVNNTYTFAATASVTTPSGLYTADVSLIATGTF